MAEGEDSNKSGEGEREKEREMLGKESLVTFSYVSRELNLISDVLAHQVSRDAAHWRIQKFSPSCLLSLTFPSVTKIYFKILIVFDFHLIYSLWRKVD